MVDAVETMAYEKGEVPWHGLGNPVDMKQTPSQMAKAAKINWTVSKRPMQFLCADGKTWKGATDDFALCRDTDNAHLSTVGKLYKPVQNEEALEFFTKWVKAGHMTMETAGSLWGGRYIWGLARIGKDFAVKLGKTKDDVRGYLLLSSPHVRGKSLLMQFTAIRVVCWNTLTFALGENLKGNEGAFRMPHSQNFDDDMKAKAEQSLGLAHHQMEAFEAATQILVKKKAKPEAVEEFFCEVLQWDPKKAAAKAKAKAKGKKDVDDEAKEPRRLIKFRQALLQAPGAQLPTAMGTWWGALNAVSYVIDHDVGNARDTALTTSWFGTGGNTKRRAFELAVEAAK